MDCHADTPPGAYQCSLCKVFFETYSEATQHLGLKHSTHLNSQFKFQTCSSSSKSQKFYQGKRTSIYQGNLINYRNFPELQIQLTRLTSKEIAPALRRKLEAPVKPVGPKRRTSGRLTSLSQNSVSTRRNSSIFSKACNELSTAETPASKSMPPLLVLGQDMKAKKRKRTSKAGPNEIKLETLKASEIEALISDLYQKPSSIVAVSSLNKTESNGSSEVSMRKSRRKIKPRLPNDFEELNSDEEEIIQTGSTSCQRSQQKKRRKIKHDDDDEDFSLSKSDGRDYTSSTTTKEKSNNPIECDVCGKKFKLMSVYLPHKKFHEKMQAPHPLKPFQCPVCKHRFVQRFNLQRHFSKHLENNPFRCKFLGCGRGFDSEYHLRRHEALHTSRVVFKCQECPVSYTHHYKLVRHIKNFHSSGSTATRKRKFRKPSYHVKAITELATPAQDCNTSQASSDIDIKEDPDSIEDNRFEVESVHLEDQIVVKTEDNKDIHVKGETLVPLSVRRSPRVSKPARIQSDFVRTSRSPSFNCEDRASDGDYSGSDSSEEETSVAKNNKLNESLNSNSKAILLKNAMLSDPVVRKLREANEEGIKLAAVDTIYNRNQEYGDFSCKICSWVGARSGFLQKHMEKHHNLPLVPNVEPTPDNPLGIEYLCRNCGFTSKSSAALSRHILKSHQGGKKFGCSFCSRRFLTKDRRARHEKLYHLSVKKHACDKCDYRSTQKRSLKQHMLEKHDPEYQKRKEIDFKCEICGKVLSNRKNLVFHIKCHTTKRQYKAVECQLCGQKCATSSSLTRHIQYVHMQMKNPYNEKKKLRTLKSAQLVSISAEDKIENPPRVGVESSQTLKTPGEESLDGEILGF